MSHDEQDKDAVNDLLNTLNNIIEQKPAESTVQTKSSSLLSSSSEDEEEKSWRTKSKKTHPEKHSKKSDKKETASKTKSSKISCDSTSFVNESKQRLQDKIAKLKNDSYPLQQQKTKNSCSDLFDICKPDFTIDSSMRNNPFPEKSVTPVKGTTAKPSEANCTF